jgi:5'(3')-deoxyribonucleotidase
MGMVIRMKKKKEWQQIETINPFLGLCHMAVCCEKNTTAAEILSHCNRTNPSGTTNGWCDIIDAKHKDKKLRPVQCSDDKNRLHVLVVC